MRFCQWILVIFSMVGLEACGKKADLDYPSSKDSGTNNASSNQAEAG